MATRLDSATIVLAEAQRQLGNQEAALNNARITAGAVLTGSSFVMAVFGAVAATQKHRSTFSGWAEGFALLFFGFMILAAVVILRPRTWHTQHDLAEKFLDPLRSPETSPSPLALTLKFAKYLNDFRAQNNCILKRLQIWLTIACVLLAAQVIAWALAVA